MMIAVLLALVSTAQETPNQNAERDNDVIVTCMFDRHASGNESISQERYFLGWQFDANLQGQVPLDSVRFADPNNLLRERAVEEVGRTSSITFFAVDPTTRDRRSAVVISLVPGGTSRGDIFAGSLGTATSGAMNVTHTGTCTVVLYPSGSNMMFDAMRRQPATTGTSQ